MVGIKSTIGNSNFEKPTNRNFIVEDESDNKVLKQNQIPKERLINPSVAQGLRRQAIDQQEQIEQKILFEAQRRIELITGLGRKTKDITIENITFTLRSLKGFERNYLSQVIAKQSRIKLGEDKFGFNTEGMYNIKIEALSHSLYLIDGQPIEIILGTINQSYEDQISARKDLIVAMDSELTDYLFSHFERLSAETRDGYAPKTTEEVKEVVDTIRKSSSDI